MKTKRALQGFTLIELMAVMAIIAILAGLILGISGLASFKSDEAKTKAQIERIKQLLQEYRVEHGFMPEDEDEDEDKYWENVIQDLDETFYIETDELKDPWGEEYQYSRDSRYVGYVWSYGPDGQGGTEDDIGQHD